MIDIITKTRKWGNSVGVLLGKKIKPGKIVRVIVTEKKFTKVGDVFGKYKMNISTEKLMKEIDEDLGL